MTEDKLNDLLSGLPRGLEPGRDLWPDIDLRISAGGEVADEHRERRVIALRLLPAAALVVIAVSVFVVGRWVAPFGDVRLSQVIRSADPGTREVLVSLQAAERRYTEAREALVKGIASLAELYGDGGATAIVEEHFAEIDQVIENLVAEVLRDPAQQHAIHRLAMFYGVQTTALVRAGSYVQGFQNQE